MYKIETHLHTPLISPCAVLSPEELVLSYKEAGYAAVTVTDHYKASAFSYAGISWDAPGDKLYAFLEGYRRVKEVGDQAGLKVYYVAVLLFYEIDNDYLVYCFVFYVLAVRIAVCSMGIAFFS